jgi:hypothetical protein
VAQAIVFRGLRKVAQAIAVCGLRKVAQAIAIRGVRAWQTTNNDRLPHCLSQWRKPSSCVACDHGRRQDALLPASAAPNSAASTG